MLKRLFIPLVLVALLSACNQEKLENRAARECKEYTQKNCPYKVNEVTTLDSLTFDVATHIFTRYFSIVTDSQSIQKAKENKDEFAKKLIEEVRNETSMKTYKDNGYSFRFVYYSDADPSLILYDKTVTKEEY